MTLEAQQQAVVDIHTPAAVTVADAVKLADLPMEEYAKAVDAQNRGEEYTPKVKVTQAEATKTEQEAAAAQAAATSETDEAGKTTAESATEDDPERLIEETHKAKAPIAKRMGELTAKRKEAEALAEQRAQELAQVKAEAEASRAEVEKFRKAAEDAAAAAQQSVVKAEDDPRPLIADFDDPNEFVTALAAHTTREEIRKSNAATQRIADENAAAARKAQEEAQEASAQAKIAALHASHMKRVEAAKTDYPDYDDKVTNNSDVKVRHDIFFAIEQSPMSADLLYHIATNPKEADALNQLQPHEAMFRLGELQAEIRIAKKPQKTKAAAPVNPIGNRESPQPKKLHEMSMEEYASHRAKEEKEAHAARYGKTRNGNRN